jgi:hypothetical protein
MPEHILSIPPNVEFGRITNRSWKVGTEPPALKMAIREKGRLFKKRELIDISTGRLLYSCRRTFFSAFKRRKVWRIADWATQASRPCGEVISKWAKRNTGCRTRVEDHTGTPVFGGRWDYSGDRGYWPVPTSLQCGNQGLRMEFIKQSSVGRLGYAISHQEELAATVFHSAVIDHPGQDDGEMSVMGRMDLYAGEEKLEFMALVVFVLVGHLDSWSIRKRDLDIHREDDPLW